MIQSKGNSKNGYPQDQDLWGYEDTLEDRKRKNNLLSEIPLGKYHKTLDIGCGTGFITNILPGDEIIGIDNSEKAINIAQRKENSKIKYIQSSIFEADSRLKGFEFDMIVITGVMYPQYIGEAHNLIYLIIDKLLKKNGILISVHIHSWYKARFPYPLIKERTYKYGKYDHLLEVYSK